MNSHDERIEAAIERMTDHVLTHGLAGATLRPLAAAAGTSDRMLLYYFADKNELLAAILGRVARRMLAEIEEAVPPGQRQPFPVLLDNVWAALTSTALQPYIPLWLELTAAAARGLQPHRDIAAQILDRYLEWVVRRLETDDDGAPSESAQLFLVTIEGMYLLKALGRDAVLDAAKWSLIQMTT